MPPSPSKNKRPCINQLSHFPLFLFQCRSPPSVPLLKMHSGKKLRPLTHRKREEGEAPSVEWDEIRVYVMTRRRCRQDQMMLGERRGCWCPCWDGSFSDSFFTDAIVAVIVVCSTVFFFYFSSYQHTGGISRLVFLQWRAGLPDDLHPVLLPLACLSAPQGEGTRPSSREGMPYLKTVGSKTAELPHLI